MDSKAYEKLEDLEIISRVLKGEKWLYRIIIRRYNGYLYKVGKSYGFNHSDVEDLMQETYINVYVNLKSFEGRSSFKTWIVRIMLNQCYHKTQRSSYKHKKYVNEFEENKSIPMQKDSQSDANRTIHNIELKHVLEDTILHLPEKYRNVFTLRELNGMNVQDTSEALGISENNVKVRLNRAKNMLQNDIKKMYSTEEIFEFNLIYCDTMVERVMKAIDLLSDSKEA